MRIFFIQYLRRINKLNIYKFLIFLPLLIYLGKRSLIAYDEGIYALQAKWILNNENWISPMWWGEISLDRTIGIQALIAFSQRIFGQSNFSIYIPNLVASFFIIFFTYKLHIEFFKNKYPIASPLILATSFLWINYSHLATQDIVYSSIVILGVYSSVKFQKEKKNVYLILSGMWIGFAFMLKTYLTFIPFLAIIPFFLYFRIIYKKIFWIGFLIGFIPFLIWSSKVINIYDYSTYSGLFKKLIFLSGKTHFTNPIYYYVWNIPVNIFPWSAFAFLGIIRSYKSKKFVERYILFFYPLINILLLSFFSTKTPYYPLQILPFISLNTFKGLIDTICNRNLLYRINYFLNFYLIPLILLILVFYINSGYSALTINKDDLLLISSLLLILTFGWLSIGLFKSTKNKLMFALLGPYLMTCILVQSGTLSDRAKDLRIAAENLVKEESLGNHKIEVIKGDINSTNAHSKIIKISLLMPNIGNGIKDLDDLKINHYAWITNTNLKLLETNKFEIINDSEAFSPWKLVKREN